MTQSFQNILNNSLTNGSGILQEAITLLPCAAEEATHFALCHGNKIKYLIELNGGIPYLRKTVAPYNTKLTILLYALPFIPWKILKIARLGFFAKVNLQPTVAEAVPESHRFNILVGTYDEAQKIVLQCFSKEMKSCTYVKVGNQGSAKQMEREIEFLRHSPQYKSFSIPQQTSSLLLREGALFNILITKDFQGERIVPLLSKELLRITKEIAGEPIEIDGELYSFSHGDFTPWNVRSNGNNITVFDWEHCGLRPVGYDAAYFIIMVEIALHKRSFDEAFKIAQAQINKYDNALQLNYHLIRLEFAKTTKTLKF